jgi:WD40 repeat protein
MLKIFLFISITTTLFAKDLTPSFTLQTSGLVNDFVIDEDKLYVATDEGIIDIFDFVNQKRVSQIKIKPTLNNSNELLTSNILSVDRYKGKTLIVSTGKNGYKNLFLHDGEKLTQILSEKDKKSIRKARFIDEDNFIFGSVSYDLSRFSTNDNYTVYKNQIAQSAFSDLELSRDKKSMVSVAENGEVTVTSTKSGKILRKPKAINLDNIYKVAYQNGVIITAGQDRRVAIYQKDKKPYFIKSDFLVYAVGLSPSGKIGVYSCDEKSNLQLFDVKSGKKLHRLIGHFALPSTIRFFDEDGFFSAGYERKIFYWHLKNL